MEKEIREIVKEYLKENLRISISEHKDYDGGTTIKVDLYFQDEGYEPFATSYSYT